MWHKINKYDYNTIKIAYMSYNKTNHSTINPYKLFNVNIKYLSGHSCI